MIDTSDLNTLSTAIYEFRNGRQYHWTSRRSPDHHRISSPDWWYDWAKDVKEYPCLVTLDGVQYKIAEIGSGVRRRHDGAQVLLYRYLEPNEEVEDSWYWKYNVVIIDDTTCLARVERQPLARVMRNDSEFDKWVRRLNNTFRAMPELNIEEVPEVPCRNGCRRSFCYCDDDKVTYEINEHSMTIDLNKGSKTIRITLEEAKELASFLGSAKEKIKEAKIAAIKQQQDDLAKQLSDIQNI